MVSGWVPRNRLTSMVSRSSRSTSSSAELGTARRSSSSVVVVGPVQPGQEPLELGADLLAAGQVPLLGGERQRLGAVVRGPVERVVLLLEPLHHVADLLGVLELR